MARNPYTTIGNCPVCCEPITGYAIGEMAVYQFLPCECKSATWIVTDGKFVGGSSKESVVTTTFDGRREELGRRVREVWVAWAKTQPNPKPEWLVPWEELEERYKEVDRRIGSALWGDFVNEFSEQMANAAMKAIEQVHHAKPN